MKTLFIMAIVGFILTGCQTKEIASLNKDECKQSGHTFIENQRLNYRTGEYELKGNCIETKLSSNS